MTVKKTTATARSVKKVTKKAVNAAKKAVKKPVKKVAERALVSFDFAVKYLLRGKKDYVVINGFLSELLGKKVEVKSLVNVENIKADKNDKTNRVDLKAQIDGGEIAVFEIQFTQAFDFFGKVLFGVSSAVVDQVNEGDEYSIKKVYSIIVAYFNLSAKREYLFSGKLNHFRGVHYKNELIPFAQANVPESSDKVDIHPEYYLILPKMFDEKLRSRFDEWVYVLKKSAARDDFKAAGIKEAKRKLDYLRMSPEERVVYRRYMDNRRSADSMIRTAEGKGFLGGVKKGRQEERTKNIRSMYNAGATIAQIITGFGLTENNVRRILGLSPGVKKRAVGRPNRTPR